MLLPSNALAVLQFFLNKDEQRRGGSPVHLSKKIRVDDQQAFVRESVARASSEDELLQKPKEITKAPSDDGSFTRQKVRALLTRHICHVFYFAEAPHNEGRDSK